MKTKDIVLAGVLTAFSIMIPLWFGGVLAITIPPFSATIASHVPVMLAMAVNPLVAVVVGLGSALGFLLKGLPLVIVARAAMHPIFAFVGAQLIKRGVPFTGALAVTLPIHAGLEALVVLPFGFDIYSALVIVGIGTALHHAVDSAISLAVYRSLISAKVFPSVTRTA